MKILIHSSDEVLLRDLATILRVDQHVIEESTDAESAANWLADFPFDVAVIDCGLQIALPREIAGIGDRPPVLALTSNDEHPHALAILLDSGADDAIGKPFDCEELRARLRALQRRDVGARQSLLVAGVLSWDPRARTARCGDQVLNLTAKEADTFAAMVARPGTCLTKEMFLNQLYGGRDEPEAKIIDVFMCKLRKKIAAANGGDPVIRTVWGRGYMAPATAEAERRAA